MTDTEATFKILAKAATLKPEQASSYACELDGTPEAALEVIV